MSNDYILKQVPSKLRIADVTMDISITYGICCLRIFELVRVGLQSVTVWL